MAEPHLNEPDRKRQRVEERYHEPEGVANTDSAFEEEASDVNDSGKGYRLCDSFLACGGRMQKLHCKYCGSDVTSKPRFHCAECDEDIVFCVDCFSVGVEIQNHKNTHSYRVSDCLSFPIVEKDWSAAEELLLIEGIERFGLGNWRDIADYVGGKSEKKCQSHYMNFYLGSQAAPLPAELGDEMSEKTRQLLSKGSDSSTQKSTESERMTPTDSAKIPGAELCGYLPLRGDFDVEHDNDAELILADMEFSAEDHPTERELKLQVIEIYNSKLDERERRKAFVLERGLLDYKKHQANERRRPKDEREVIAAMRPYARFHSPEEHKDFVSGLLTALRLRKRIAQLQHYRKIGLRTLQEVERYEEARKKGNHDSGVWKVRQDASYVFGAGRQKQSRDRTSKWLKRESVEINGNENSQNNSVDLTSTTSEASQGSNKKTNSSTSSSGNKSADLLSASEVELCQSLLLSAEHYLEIKAQLLREGFEKGYITRDRVSDLVKLEVGRSQRIYDFFLHAGWIAALPGSGIVRPPTKTSTV